MEAIKEADEQARRHRVDGVPFFIINGKITLSGAQPPEAFLDAFRQAHDGGRPTRTDPCGE
jgi:predicted DsbA family dithiol-disulfide isomerase